MGGTSTTGKIAFSTTDFYGNKVKCHLSTWEHIKERHPEMAPHRADIKDTVENPDARRQSTLRPDTCTAYEGFGIGPSAGGIRVLVEYDDTTHMAGGTTGKVVTAYPPDPAHSSNVGPMVLINKGTGS